jgi:hypothetical protein
MGKTQLQIPYDNNSAGSLLWVEKPSRLGYKYIVPTRERSFELICDELAINPERAYVKLDIEGLDIEVARDVLLYMKEFTWPCGLHFEVHKGFEDSLEYLFSRMRRYTKLRVPDNLPEGHDYWSISSTELNCRILGLDGKVGDKVYVCE